MRTPFCCNTRVRKHLVEPTASFQMSPRKVRFFNVETLRRNSWTHSVSKPIHRKSSPALRSFLLPIALTIAVRNLCVVLLSQFCSHLNAIINYTLSISHSNRSFFFQWSNFTEIQKNPCSEFLALTKHKVDAWCPYSSMIFGMRAGFSGNTCVHKHFDHFVEPTAPPPDEHQKIRNTCFLCRDFKKEKWDKFGFNTDP
jgi:hypothetical protein